jgi:hypothetical protein
MRLVARRIGGHVIFEMHREIDELARHVLPRFRRPIPSVARSY